jgi:hypothetical protein
LYAHVIRVRGDANRDGGAVTARRDGVLDAVLDERLESEPRDSHVSSGLVGVHLVAEAIAEPHAFYLEVVADDPQLIVDRDERRLMIERRSQQRRELARHLLGAARILVDQRRDRVERVEQEMRLHARLERRQLRLGRQTAGFGLVALLGSEGNGRVLEPMAQRLVRGHGPAEDQRDH